MNKNIIVAVTAAFAFATAAPAFANKPEKAEKAGDKAEKAEKKAEKVEKKADKVGDKAEKAGDKAEKAGNEKADVHAIIILETQPLQQFLPGRDDAAQRLFKGREFREIRGQQGPGREHGDAPGAA